MCGRYTLYSDVEQLKARFPIDLVESGITPSYNVAPTQEVPAIIHSEESNVLTKLHWGLVPFWAKDAKIGSKMINARLETVATKPAFRDAFKKRRCLIPADGFFEWTGSKGQKQPVYITLPDRKPLVFAGLWETWQDKAEPGNIYRSCTIITREASGPLQEIHHRMPVALDSRAYGEWLDHESLKVSHLQEILSRSAITEFAFYPVSKQVNTVRNNEPCNIKPVEVGA